MRSIHLILQAGVVLSATEPSNQRHANLHRSNLPDPLIEARDGTITPRTFPLLPPLLPVPSIPQVGPVPGMLPPGPGYPSAPTRPMDPIPPSPQYPPINPSSPMP